MMNWSLPLLYQLKHRVGRRVDLAGFEFRLGAFYKNVCPAFNSGDNISDTQKYLAGKQCIAR